VTTRGWPPDCPPDLVSAAASHQAEPLTLWREPPRAYVKLTSPSAPLFARYTTAPRDEPTLAHEAAVRDLVGVDGPLRAPPVIERGASWLLERWVPAAPCRGPEVVDAIVAAATALADLWLPPSPQAAGRGRRLGALWRAPRLLRSSLPGRDVLRARRLARESRLPVVTSHGDFHPGNIRVAQGAAWVIDWELSGSQPAGYDLMRLWATVDLAADRERIFEATLDLVGQARKDELVKLRYAMLVQTIAGKLASPAQFDRDPEGADELLRLLPEIRESVAEAAPK
jgi:hypothetical protein